MKSSLMRERNCFTFRQNSVTSGSGTVECNCIPFKWIVFLQYRPIVNRIKNLAFKIPHVKTINNPKRARPTCEFILLPVSVYACSLLIWSKAKKEWWDQQRTSQAAFKMRHAAGRDHVIQINHTFRQLLHARESVK